MSAPVAPTLFICNWHLFWLPSLNVASSEPAFLRKTVQAIWTSVACTMCIQSNQAADRFQPDNKTSDSHFSLWLSAEQWLDRTTSGFSSSSSWVTLSLQLCSWFVWGCFAAPFFAFSMRGISTVCTKLDCTLASCSMYMSKQNNVFTDFRK